MKDPTRKELDDAINRIPFSSEFDTLDREEAIWWFANDWHIGQSSNLYSVLSTSEFKPAPSASGPELAAMIIYDMLCQEFIDP